MTKADDQPPGNGVNIRRQLRRMNLVERAIAADPAFSRLRLASRAALAMVVTGAVLTGIAFLHPLPPAAYGLSGIMVFIGTLAVRDPTPRKQAVTRAIAGVGGVASATLAGALSPWPVIASIAFLGVIFISVYIRRFGLRWTTVGTIAFMAYFMGDYLPPHPAQFGWLALGVAVALVTTHLIRTVVLPDHPERDFRRALRTIDHRINVILLHLLDTVRAGETHRNSRKILRTQIAQLRDIVLMAEGFIPQGGNGNWSFAEPARDLATALFDLQMAVERFVRHRHVSLPTADALAGLLQERGHRLGPQSPAEPSDPAVYLLDQIGAARSRINTLLSVSPAPAFAVPVPPAATAGPRKGAGPGATPLVPVSLRRPIQVTMACGIAMLAGSLVSPRLWFWAVITAYVVFNNTKTRADTTVRAAERGFGTLGGVVIGTLLATALHGQLEISIALIPVFFFLAFYFLRVSYAWMVFFITNAVAILYGLTGMFSPDLLLLRLAETLIGGAAGAFAAFFVFPEHSSPGIRKATADFFEALRDLVTSIDEQSRGVAPTGALPVASRKLDRCYAELAVAVRPLGGPWSFVSRFGNIRERLLLLASCAHWAREVSHLLQDAPAMDEDTQERVSALTHSILTRLTALRAASPSWFERGATPRGALALPPSSDPGTPTRHGDTIRALKRIDELLQVAEIGAATGNRGTADPSLA